MKRLHLWGGIASIYEALAYIGGMAFFMGVLDYMGTANPESRMRLVIENLAAISAMNIFIYVIFGFMLLVLVFALNERWKDYGPSLLKVATASGIIWAGVVIASGMIFNVGAQKVALIHAEDPEGALTVWLAVEAVADGLGGGVEILGGVWVTLVSIAGLRSKSMAAMHYLGLLVGLAGIVTIVPPAGAIGGIVFGLGQIIWFLWIGIYLIWSKPAGEMQNRPL